MSASDTVVDESRLTEDAARFCRRDRMFGGGARKRVSTSRLRSSSS